MFDFLKKILDYPPWADTPDRWGDACSPKMVTQTGVSEVIPHKCDGRCNKCDGSSRCLMLSLTNAMEVSLNAKGVSSLGSIW